MSHRKVLSCVASACFAIALAGCSGTPAERSARYLKRGEALLVKKDFAGALIEFRNAARLLPNDAEAYYQMGVADLALRNFNQAVLTFQKAVNLNPKHDAARLKLAELMATSSKTEVLQEVERMAQKVLSVEPESTEALRIRALAELRLGKTDAAVESLQQSIEKAPKNLQAAVTLAATKLMQRDPAGGEAVLKNLAQKAGSVDAWMALCRYYRLIGKEADAESAIRQGIRVDPKRGDALFELAVCQLRAKNASGAEETFQRLSALPDPKFRAVHAAFQFNSGRRAEAVKELETLASKYDGDRAIRNQLVAAYLSTGRAADAEKTLNRALKSNDKDADALEMRARIYLGAGKRTEAEADLNKALQYRTNSADAHYLRAKLYQNVDGSQYQQELAKAVQLRPDDLETRLELSRACRANHSPQGALEYLDKMPNAQKGMLGTIVERNWALFDLRRDAEMKDRLGKALKVIRDPELLLQEALLDMRLKQFPAAKAALEEILSKDPENYRAVDTMLALYMAQKQTGASVQWMKQHAARRPASAPMRNVLAQWLAATGDSRGARAEYERAVALDSKFKPARLELAKMDLAAGNLAPAREMLNTLLADDPRDLPARMVLGSVEEQAARPVDAMQQYQVVLVANPNHVVALNNLACLLGEVKSVDQAIGYAEKAYQLAPGSAAVNDTLGWLYYQKGTTKGAVEHLASAVKLEPTAQRYRHLAMAYQQDGREDLARKFMDDAQKMQPDQAQGQSARRVAATPAR